MKLGLGCSKAMESQDAVTSVPRPLNNDTGLKACLYIYREWRAFHRYGDYQDVREDCLCADELTTFSVDFSA